MKRPGPPLRHRCWVEIDGRAMRHNVKILRRHLPAGAPIMADLKGNAYGHGLVPMARELALIGIDWIAVASVAEGVALREAGLMLPILLLGTALREEIPGALTHHLTLTISSHAEARAMNRWALGSGSRCEVLFAIGASKNRPGSLGPEARDELARIRQLSRIHVTGLCPVFDSAVDGSVTVAHGFPGHLVPAGPTLYGVLPNAADRRLGFRPILAWKSRIGFLRQVGAGRTVSYGATYRLPAPERHAVVAMGYGDGYRRLLSGIGHLLVSGVRCPIRGRITMDQIVIDVTRVRDCYVGDEVVALGRQAGEEISACELANRTKTIPAEILTHIAARVTRTYRHFKCDKGGSVVPRL